MSRDLERGLFISAIIATLLLTHLYITFYGSASRDNTLKTITVPRGATSRLVAKRLSSVGLIASKKRFLFAARLMGADRDIKAGEYALSPAMSTARIINILKSGEVKQYTVTIPEGYAISEIAALLKSRGLGESKVFLNRAADKALVKRLGLPGPTLEGYLFPDTYRLRKDMSAEEIIEKMSARFKEIYNRDFKRAARKKGMDMRTVATLASMIEKETQSAQERPIISSVFQNRLKKGIKLQSDPTVIYAMKAFDGNIRKKDLKIQSPYNTYLHYGLPPGPIANAGKEAIRAVISPAKTKYLYFVSKNNGTHYFSKTYREHVNAVNRFQKRRRPVATER